MSVNGNSSNPSPARPADELVVAFIGLAMLPLGLLRLRLAR
jgi:hypothetical protein